LLGKGGIGEVYRGRDTKLKREVAVKILPDECSCDPDRVSRFQREAQSLAAPVGEVGIKETSTVSCPGPISAVLLTEINILG
jgi:hypothetical protein